MFIHRPWSSDATSRMISVEDEVRGLLETVQSGDGRSKAGATTTTTTTTSTTTTMSKAVADRLLDILKVHALLVEDVVVVVVVVVHVCIS